MDDGWRVCKDDRDCIEADPGPIDSGPRGIGAGGAHDVLALFLINCALRTAKLVVCSRFHFHKDDKISLPRDDVYFGLSAPRAIVARYHHIAGAAEIAMSQIFSAATKCGGRAEILGLEPVAGGVAQFPEKLRGLNPAVSGVIASSSHSMTLPRIRKQR
jgi:hypothetical protein